MLYFITQAIGPFAATLVLCLIALGIISILRDGIGDEDRRSFSSDLASKFGVLGMILLPISALSIVWMYFRSAVFSDSFPATAGIVAGAFASILILGRQALLPKRSQSPETKPNEQDIPPNP